MLALMGAVATATAGECKVPAQMRSTIGHMLTREVERRVLRETGASELRVSGPHDAASTDRRSNRVHILIDEQRRILAVQCN
jgi:hypothetical protein